MKIFEANPCNVLEGLQQEKKYDLFKQGIFNKIIIYVRIRIFVLSDPTRYRSPPTPDELKESLRILN